MPRIEFPCPKCGSTVTAEASEIEAPSAVCPACGQMAIAPSGASDSNAPSPAPPAHAPADGRTAADAIRDLVHEYFEAGRVQKAVPRRKIAIAVGALLGLLLLGLVVLRMLGR